ncbi:hypothetical protein Bbelb_302030 [Branchiostoma belcheri]|nr:hypothetical protein Bbelb_302030 [Branchiostoma belcheri]
MEEETDGSPVEDGISHVLSIGSTSRDLQTAYLIISLVLSVGCGLLLIFLVWKKEYLQKPSHFLRCNLAVDDIIFSGYLIPVRINALWVFQTKAFKVMVPHAIVLTASLITTLFRVATLRAVISEEQMSQCALIIAARVALLLYLTLSSMANPVIYSLQLPEFRRACRELCGWRTNANPPAVPARRHRQDEVEMATVTGPRRGAPASELAPAQTSSEGTIIQPTAEFITSDQARKQTTQAFLDQRLEQGTVAESASGRPSRLTVRAEVHAEPTPRPKEEDMTVTLPGQLQTDAETTDVPTLYLDTEIDEATSGGTLNRPAVRTKLAWGEDTIQ